ncbi:MAG TPA: hypothetical protein VF849_01440 [Blattabacteriaceae bacterium]
MTDKQIKLAADIYNLERQKEIIDSELKPKREELLNSIKEYGTYECGDHIVIKKHIEETHVKAFDRRPYDTLQIK